MLFWTIRTSSTIQSSSSYIGRRRSRSIHLVLTNPSTFLSQQKRTVPQHRTSMTSTYTTMRDNDNNGTTKDKSTSTGRRIILHWFRDNDLRLYDNPALLHSTTLLATAMSQQEDNHDIILPIYCFDTTRLYGNLCTTSFANDIMKCGPRRAQFLLESVIDLRQQLQQQCKSELLVACGNPTIIFYHLINYVKEHYKTNNIRIVCQNEVASEEIQITKDVRYVMKQHFPNHNGKLIYEVWGSTMYERNELPYDREALYHMPNGFSPFRNDVERKCTIHKPLAIPNYLPFPHNDWSNDISLPSTIPENLISTVAASSYPMTDGKTTTTTINHTPIIVSTTYMPTLLDLGYTSEQITETQYHDPRGFSDIFKGGTTAGMARVQQYIWEQDLLQNYFDTRNGMMGANYSTKFSPWLAHGCISPRMIVTECQKYERIRIKNKSTYWVVFELLWRDFCKFFVVKHTTKIFRLNGIIQQNKDDEEKKWNYYEPSFEAWKNGMTGYPLVDANMREMKATGFMSNRGRQNVASFLALDLKYDWRYGADWFESNLIDYDVYSNWVNWCAAAGMTGGRINRFNIVKQSRDYDQHGEYIKLWIPELKDVPVPYVHEPWKMTQFQQIEYNCNLGLDYPNPIIPPFAYNASGQPGSGRTENSGSSRGGGNNSNHNNRRGGAPNNREKQRKPNSNNRNRHQKYEMTGLKEGKYNFEDE